MSENRGKWKQEDKKKTHRVLLQILALMKEGYGNWERKTNHYISVIQKTKHSS